MICSIEILFHCNSMRVHSNSNCANKPRKRNREKKKKGKKKNQDKSITIKAYKIRNQNPRGVSTVIERSICKKQEHGIGLDLVLAEHNIISELLWIPLLVPFIFSWFEVTSLLPARPFVALFASV